MLGSIHVELGGAGGRTVADIVAPGIADEILALVVQLRAVLVVLRQVPVVVADDPCAAVELLEERARGDARLRQERRGCEDCAAQHIDVFPSSGNLEGRKEIQPLQVISPCRRVFQIFLYLQLPG